MRRLGVAVTLALLLSAAVASAATPLGEDCPDGQCEITVTGRVIKTNIDRRPPAGRAGDTITQRWLIHDRKNRVIGDLLLDCRYVTSSLRLCLGQLSMPLGVLAVLGATRTTFLGQMLIAGGTGVYARAEGTLIFTATGTGRYTLSLSYSKNK